MIKRYVNALLIIIVLCAHIPSLQARHEKWDWSTIDVNATLLSEESIFKQPEFLKGFAICEYQNSGRICNNNWVVFEKKLGLNSECSCDFWHLYPEDIERMEKELNANSFRLSIEWSEIEPQEGVFNQEVIDHYHNVLNTLIAAGISPMITCLHFTMPKWFAEKGGFEKKENISFFVRFCKKVFAEFHEKVPLWCTINEPGVLAFTGYLLGIHAPGKHNPFTARTVLQNLLKAHKEVYQELKALPGGQKAQIGLVHNYLLFEPYHNDNWYNPVHYLEKLATSGINYFTNTAVMNFLRENKQYDFIGLNYYSEILISLFAGATHLAGEIFTDLQWAICPEEFYYAIHEMNKFGVPIYITENGVPDPNNEIGVSFLKRYLYALHKAIEDGCDVRGYYYWTLTDNFEWHEGFKMKFGIYSVDRNTQERTLRKSGKYFAKVFAPAITTESLKTSSFLASRPEPFAVS